MRTVWSRQRSGREKATVRGCGTIHLEKGFIDARGVDESHHLATATYPNRESTHMIGTSLLSPRGHASALAACPQDQLQIPRSNHPVATGYVLYVLSSISLSLSPSRARRGARLGSPRHLHRPTQLCTTFRLAFQKHSCPHLSAGSPPSICHQPGKPRINMRYCCERSAVACQPPSRSKNFPRDSLLASLPRRIVPLKSKPSATQLSRLRIPV